MPNNLVFGLISKNMVKRGLDAAKRSFQKFGRTVKRINTAAIAGAKRVGQAFLAVGAAIGLATRSAVGFGKAMGQVSTLIPEDDISKYTDAVKDLSVQSGKSASELAGGLYQTISAGIPKDNAISFLGTATQAAIAGATDVSTAVDGLSTALNAFKSLGGDVSKAADIMFSAVKGGKMTFEELSSSLGTVAPIAAASGVKFQDVAASMVTLTKQGLPAAEAATAIRQAIIAMNRVLGDGFAETMSLQEAFQALSDRAGGSQNELKKLIGRVQGVQAVLATTGDNAAGAAQDIKVMSDNAVAALQAFGKMDETNTFAKSLRAMQAAMLDIGASVGNALLPTFKRITGAIQRFRKSMIFKKAVAAIGRVTQAFSDLSASLFGLRGIDKFKKSLVGVGDVVQSSLRIALINSIKFAAMGFVKVAQLFGKALLNAVKHPINTLVGGIARVGDAGAALGRFLAVTFDIDDARRDLERGLAAIRSGVEPVVVPVEVKTPAAGDQQAAAAQQVAPTEVEPIVLSTAEAEEMLGLDKERARIQAQLAQLAEDTKRAAGDEVTALKWGNTLAERRQELQADIAALNAKSAAFAERLTQAQAVDTTGSEEAAKVNALLKQRMAVVDQIAAKDAEIKKQAEQELAIQELQNVEAEARAKAEQARAEAQRLAKQGIKEFMAERKKRKEGEQDEADALKREQRLEEKKARGIKLSKRDRDFLAALEERRAAQARAAREAGIQRQKAEDAQRKAQELQKANNKATWDSVKLLGKIEKELTDNLRLK